VAGHGQVTLPAVPTVDYWGYCGLTSVDDEGNEHYYPGWNLTIKAAGPNVATIVYPEGPVLSGGLHDSADQDGVEDIVEAGATFGYIPAGFYAGGMAFPSHSRGGQVYLSREAGGVWHLERWDRGPDGGWVARPVCAPGPTRLVRPWPVTNPDGGVDILALALDRYDDSYFDTRSDLLGWRGPA